MLLSWSRPASLKTDTSSFLFTSLSPGTSLVQTLCQLGPDLTADPETVIALLRRFGVSEGSPPRESQVSEILQTLARYAGEGSPLCDVGAVVKAICSLVRLLNIFLPLHLSLNHFHGSLEILIGAVPSCKPSICQNVREWTLRL